MIVIDGSGRALSRWDESSTRIVFCDDAKDPRIDRVSAESVLAWLPPGEGNAVEIRVRADVVEHDADFWFGTRRIHIAAGSRITQQEEGAPFVIEPQGGNPRVVIETSGPRAGILSVADLDPSDPSDLSIRYFYYEPGTTNFAALRFNVFEPAAARGGSTRIELDPNRPFDPNRSRAVTTAGGTWTSTFLTTIGEPVVLQPQGGSWTSAQAWDPAEGTNYETPDSAWDVVNDVSSLRVMLGLSGSEFALVQPTGGIGFSAGYPAFAPYFLQPGKIAYAPPLDPDAGGQTVTTAWTYFLTGPDPMPPSMTGAPGYYSAAADAPFFKPEISVDALLEPFDVFTLPLSGRSAFPAVPYGGFQAPPDAGWPALLEQFEQSLLAPARTWQMWTVLGWPGPPTDETTEYYATTPQGMYAQFGPSRGWLELDFALSQGASASFFDITGALRDALLANQLFLVITNAAMFDQYVSHANLGVDAADWTFLFPEEDWVAGNGPILIFKASDQDFLSLVNNLPAWTLADQFNDQSGLSDIQARLLTIIEDAQNKAKSNPFYSYFVDTVLATESSGASVWNGFICFNAVVPAQSFPPQLRGLAPGIEGGAVTAHHVGVNGTSFTLSKDEIQPGNSAVFGLILYSNDAPLDPSGDYDFRVLSLDVEIVNSVMVAFSSRIELLINKLFGEGVGSPNTLILNGQWQHNGDGDSFSFTFSGNNEFDVTSAVVKSLTVTDAQYVTLQAAAGASGPVSEFILNGELQFRSTGAFDPFSYGATAPNSEPSALALRNLQIFIEPGAQPGSPTQYFFDCGEVTFDPSASTARDGSLAQQFPTALAGMKQSQTSSGAAVTPASLGYFKAGSPLDGVQDLGDEWYALSYDLSLGSAGSLARLMPFTASLLVAWSPSSDGYNASLWLSLPGSGSNNKTITIEGTITLTIGGATFALAPTGSYLLFFNHGFLETLNIPLVPYSVGAGLDVNIFGNPDPSGTRTVAWYATSQSQQSWLVSNILHVDFFGLSQNLSRRDGQTPATIADAVATMKSDYVAVDDTTDNPLSSLPALKFSGSGNWMIGLHMNLLGFIEISGVWADPALYGLHIQVSNSNAFHNPTSFEFEIFYTKVTDTIGLYHVLLQLPDKARKWKLEGGTQVVLPVIGLDYYTNGNYRFDFGFPDGLSFSRSFSVTVEDFVGKGGFFLGRFNTATSPIPQPCNGAFSPITMFGLGLSIGKQVAIPDDDGDPDTAVLAASASVALIGIVQGTFAPFTLTGDASPTETWYCISGVIAVSASIAGQVNLRIIRIAVSATASLSITFTLEPYKALDIEVSASIEVRASVTIFKYFTIPLSFSTTVPLSFTIGANLPTPWHLPSSDALASPFMLRNQRSRYRRPRFTSRDLARMANDGGGTQPDWTPVRVFSSPAPVFVAFVPMLTVARIGDERPSTQVVMTTMLANSIDAAARTAAEVRSMVTEGAENASFNVIAGSLLYWAIAAQTQTKDPATTLVTIGDLQSIAAFLSDPTNRDEVFTYDAISRFLDLNCSVMAGPTAPADPLSLSMFPMIPPLIMGPSGPPPVDFSTFHPVDEQYVAALERYFAQLQQFGGNGGNGSAAARHRLPLEDGEDSVSFAKVVFSDYFGMIAAEVARSAHQTMSAFPYEPTGSSDETLQSIADTFDGAQVELRTRAGDNMLTVAAELRVSTAELRAWNPWLRDRAAAEPLPQNSVVVARTGPTVPAIGEKNASYPLQPGAGMSIKDVRYQIRGGDSLYTIANGFNLDPQDLFSGDGEANQNNPSLLAVGATMFIPDHEDLYPVHSGDTLGSITKHFFRGDPGELFAIVTQNKDQTKLLNPLAVMLVPRFPYEIAAGDTLGALAARYDMTIDEIAIFGATAQGLLMPYDASGPRFIVPDVASMTGQHLWSAMIDSGEMNNIAAMSSHFLMNGLQVPATGPDGANFNDMHPLYETIGQQFPAPDKPGFVTFTKSNDAPDWLTLELNGTPSPNTFVELTEDMLASAPSPLLELELVYGPTGMVLYRDIAPRYTLPSSMNWQSATAPHVPGATATWVNSASIWTFPEGLVTAISAGAISYELATLPASGSNGDPIGLWNYAWGAAIPIRARQTPALGGSSDSGSMPNTYTIAGADPSARDLLLQAWQFAANNPTATDVLYLLHKPADDVNSNGLASDILNLDATFLLKTNLTTVTQDTSFASADDDSSGYYAHTTSIPQFLELLWEACVTGSGGFYLNYATTSGDGLPPAMFASGNTADLWVVVLLGAQNDVEQPNRLLYEFNNAAFLTGSSAPGAGSLFVQLRNPQPQDLQRHAIVAPGTVGFALARNNPTGASGPTALTEQLFSLVGYHIQKNDYFVRSNEGSPAGPILGPTGPTAYWTYQQAIPAFQFGVSSSCPPSVALPDANANPYRGITGPPVKPELSYATVTLGFRDMFGNETDTDPELEPLPLPVGYTDDLIPVSAWPGAAFAYELQPGGNGVELSTQLSLDCTGFDPDSAARAAQRYASIFYQVQQPDLTFSIESNLGTPLVAPDDLKVAMQSFVASAYVFTAAAATLQPAGATSGTKEGDETLDHLANRLSVTPAAAAVANQDLVLTTLFQGAVVQPTFIDSPKDGTLNSIASSYQPSPYPPPACTTAASAAPGPRLRVVRADEGAREGREGGATPSDGGLTPQALAEMNAAAPLTPGGVLQVQPYSTTGRSMTPAHSSLAALAKAAGGTVYSLVADPNNPSATVAVGLYPENKDTSGLIAPHNTIMLRGQSVKTDPSSTMSTLYQAFKDRFQDEMDFANALAAVWGLFTDPVTLSVDSFAVPQTGGFTLAQIPAACGSIDTIATLNANVANLFVEGAQLYVTYSCATPAGGDTIATFAEGAGITAGQFGTYNAASVLHSGVPIAVPDAQTFPSSASTRFAAYAPRQTDSLQTMQQIFESAGGATIADISRYLPGIFATGASFSVNGQPIIATAFDSLESVYERCPGLDYDAFIGLLETIAGIYRTNGAVLVPFPTNAQGKSLNDLAEWVYTTPAALLAANETIIGFFAQGAVIQSVPQGPAITAGQYETVSTALARFAALGTSVTIDDLAQANGDNPKLLARNAPFFLPPNAVVISGAFTARIPPPGDTPQDGIIFPVDVTAGIARSTMLVHPDFANAPAVYSASSMLAPLPDASNRLTAFAAAFESAFAAQHLKCATSRRTLGPAGTPGQIFAVNFGAKGVTELVADRWDPQFYAMRPLSTSLIAGTVTYPVYVSGCGLCQQKVTKNYDSVSLDDWMGQLLDTIDLTLSAPYSVPAFQYGTDPGAPPADADCSGCGASAPDGPGDYSTLVQAKQDIASSLQLKVGPILVTGASGGCELLSAQDALYQQMLVRLGDAYNVTAIVQYPVTVVSPFSVGEQGLYPPRLSGKVAPVYHRIGDSTGDPPPTSIAEVARGYQVSAPYLAEVLGNVQGILRAGATVNGYTIAPNETINTLAVKLGANPSWESWVPFINSIAGDDLFYANATFPLTPVSRALGIFETLDTFARFIDRDVTDAGRGSQDVAGIFIAGTKIDIEGYQEYIVRQDDTIAKIAGGMQGPAPMTVDALSEAVADRAILTPGQTLYSILLQPDVSFSDSKVSLGNGGATAGTTPQLTFFLTVRQPSHDRKLFLDLAYNVNQIEYDIADVDGTNGYQSSSWLSFILPLGATAPPDWDFDLTMPQTQVPIPLRAYPASPLLIAQNGAASYPPGPDLGRARLWNYDFDVQTNLADQDTAHVAVAFSPNLDLQPLALSTVDDPPSLFASLACFADAYPALKNDLALLTDPATAQSPAAGNALHAIAAMAQMTAAALAAGSVTAAVADPAGPTFSIFAYAVETTTNAGGGLAELKLLVEEPPGSTLYPDLFVKSPMSGTFVGMTAIGPGTYEYPHGITAGFPVTHRYSFTMRDVIRDQNAQGMINITRNDNLIDSGPLGPTGATDSIPTSSAFVYSTAEVGFVDVLTPYLEDGVPIPTGQTAEPPLAPKIEALLTEVLELSGANPPLASNITLACNLGFATALSNGQSLLASTPVRLAPMTSVSADGVSAYAQALAESLQRWQDDNGVPPQGSSLMFDLTVYSEVAVGDTTAYKPVLRLRNLQMPIGPNGFADGEDA
jgi:hypothetical protein